MRTWITAAVAAALVAGIGGFAIFLAAKPPDTPIASGREPVWTEAAWPFPIDQWGQGWAYQCKAADCGVEVTLYLRPKIGFCNCQTGVADDEELDRVSDIDLVGDEKSALAPGQPITVHWMKGRSRSYKVGSVREIGPVARLQRQLRCDRRDCRGRKRAGRPGAGRARFPQRRSGAALGPAGPRALD